MAFPRPRTCSVTSFRRSPGNFQVIAPDYLGFGFSDQPSAKEYRYAFDNLTGLVEKLLLNHLNLTKFSIYVQTYRGSPTFE